MSTTQTIKFYQLTLLWESGRRTVRTRLTWEEAMDYKEHMLKTVPQVVECWMEKEK